MQIAVVAFNRSDYFSQALSAIANAEDCERWSVLVHVDSVNGAAREPTESSIAGNSEVIALCEKYSVKHPFLNFEYHVADRNLGCWSNKRSCVAAAFDRDDDVLVIEDDIVLSKDALVFCEWMKSQGIMDQKGVFQLSLFSYFFPAGLSPDSAMQDVRRLEVERLFHVRNWATPWGWYLTRRSWDLIKDEWNGWDQWVGHKVRELGMVEVAPLISHCNNVGVVGVNRNGRGDIDIQLRSVTSDDLSGPSTGWSPGLGVLLDEFRESLGSDLRIARKHAGDVFGKFHHARAPAATLAPQGENDMTGAQAAKVVSIKVPFKPSMDVSGLAIFEERLKNAKVFLEYGAGGSTLLAGRFNVPRIYSVESDRDFIASVWDSFLLQESSSKLVSCHADIGPTKEWGHPVDNNNAAKWPRYAGGCWERMRLDGVSPDLVLIDGRFRVACFCATLFSSGLGTSILFDDYGDRSYYHVVESVLSPISMHGRMAEFRVTRDLDVSVLAQLLLRHVCDAR